MPAFQTGVPRSQQQLVTFSLTDHRGRKRAASLYVGGDATPVQVASLAAAVGDASNAALMASKAAMVDQVYNTAHPDIITYDEAYSTVDHVLVMIFQNDEGDVRSLEIPAPDLSGFEADGETPNVGAGVFSAVRTTALAALNETDPVGTWAYARGFLATRSLSRTKARQALPIAEPGLGDSPPISPGV